MRSPGRIFLSGVFPDVVYGTNDPEPPLEDPVNLNRAVNCSAFLFDEMGILETYSSYGVTTVFSDGYDCIESVHSAGLLYHSRIDEDQETYVFVQPEDGFKFSGWLGSKMAPCPCVGQGSVCDIEYKRVNSRDSKHPGYDAVCIAFYERI